MRPEAPAKPVIEGLHRIAVRRMSSAAPAVISHEVQKIDMGKYTVQYTVGIIAYGSNSGGKKLAVIVHNLGEFLHHGA